MIYAIEEVSRNRKYFELNVSENITNHIKILGM